MADLIASGPDPGTQYQPSETDSVFHEDREVTLTGGPGSQMFRAYNAHFNSNLGTWGLEDSSLPAYATVQNPDGSIHYFSMPANSSPWTTWAGSGNNTVYNAVDYGMVAGTGVSQTQQQANVTALQNAVNAAIATGGSVTIPAGAYELSGTVTLPNVQGGLVIRGESTGTTSAPSAGTILVQQGIPTGPATPNQAVDTFQLTGDGNPSQWGIRFRDLTIQYASGLTIPTSGAAAINCISGVADTTAENCAFVGCPQAFAAGSSKAGLHCGLIACTVWQNQYSNTIQVLLSGPESFVLYTELYQVPMAPPHNGPTGCTGIAVHNGAEGCRIDGCHISDFYTGISIAEGSVSTYIVNCEIDAAVALNIVPATSAGTIYGVFATACTFAMLQSYTPLTPTSGVFIDTNGGPNDNVEGILLTNCLAYGYENAGLQINQGQSITVIGGKYSSNGSRPGTPVAGAGIAVTGPCAQVRIVGSDCSGVFDFWADMFTPPPPLQPYGITVVSGVANIAVVGCDLTNYGTAPLYVPTNGTDLRVTDCVGYNDQATIVSTSPAPSGTAFNGGYFGYYGPVTFYTTSTVESVISEIAIKTTNTHLTSGSFTLAPGLVTASYAVITYTLGLTPLPFVMVGQ